MIAVLRYVGLQVDPDDTNDAVSPTYPPEDVDGAFWAYSLFATIADALMAPDLIKIDHPKIFDGGAAELAPNTGRSVLAVEEA